MGVAMIGRSASILVSMWLALALGACDGGGSGEPAGTTVERTGGASASPTRSYTAETFPEGTIPDVLATDGRFTTILAILDLHDSALLSFLTVSHETSTFFAPPTRLFADLPDGTVDALLDVHGDPVARELIAGHVLPYDLRSGEFETGPLPMGDGEPVLQVTVQGGAVTIDGADVIEDLEAVNGVVHVVDGVLGIDLVTLEGSRDRRSPRTLTTSNTHR